MATYPRLASLKTFDDFQRRLDELGLELPADREVTAGAESVLAQSAQAGTLAIGNRFCILPMEGWDGTSDGKPSDLTRRRWKHFGISGAKLMWGGEAVAVRHDGRANPNQLCLTEANQKDIAQLRELLIAAHVERFGDDDGLVVGLQLTHSGRYAKPNDHHTPEPRIVQRNPALDPRVRVDDDTPILTDDALKALIDDFVAAAARAQKLGFDFVDIKHCHGYLGHELLSGIDRPGEFGGSFENRTRFLRDIVAGIRSEAPGLELGVRLSVFDFVPYCQAESGVGVPDPLADPRLVFGSTPGGDGIDLTEPLRFLELMQQLGMRLICTTAGSPYYTPHLQRPAFFPPSDGYQPPEDPLVGVQRQIAATAQLKQRFPEMFVVGSGYTYLQDWLPNVAQAVIRDRLADSIGLGRMVLSYPDLPADVLEGQTLARKRICRTFSDCTTAPRKGMISGCYPLDTYYKEMPERKQLQELKKLSVRNS
ncbi:NADH:flavin oxidoreductase [Roseiconus nitratireducens]|uniref:NADH:flavin oxidoreductase n=1 Tax=Roseiconus nitratireducens TaxID=2605748 RepID=A0A5M6D200_9BACT|nr:NADH:flavin oxidoreductase [Roseiconus nitratireducens]KAA5541478.1 NADH:flavin oxidoreductase [Roseiconus nitratireducens]